MSNIKLLFTGCIAALLVSSCGMMNDGFSGSSIQKRKYTKGFYFSKNKSWSKEDGEKKSAELKDEKTILSDEQIPVTEEKQPLVKTETVNSEAVIQQPSPAEKKTDQTSDKTNQKNESGKKSGTVEKKNNGSVAAPRSRKERVPERYIPMRQEAIKNKVHHISHSGADDFQVLCIILTILIPFVGVAVYTNLDLTKTLICLLLTLLFYIPGLIYGLLVVLDKI